ncbi:hypothetical protein D3C72_1625310 [compost metagenome]
MVSDIYRRLIEIDIRMKANNLCEIGHDIHDAAGIFTEECMEYILAPAFTNDV